MQKGYVFSTPLLKKFPAALLVGCEPFPALKQIIVLSSGMHLNKDLSMLLEISRPSGSNVNILQ